MLKRLLYLILGIVGFSVAVSAFNVFSTFQIKKNIENEVSFNTPNYRLLLMFNEEILDLKDQVTQAALSKFSTEIEESQQRASETLNQLFDTAKKINPEYLSQFELVDGEQKTQLTQAQLLEFLKEIQIDTQKTFEITLELTSKTKDLDKERKELSKMYRAETSLLSKSKEAYPNLARATLTTLSSRSSKDINFAGIAVYEDAVKIYDAIFKSENDRKSWEKFKDQYKRTVALANTVASFSEDNQIQIYRDKLDTFRKKIVQIRELAEAEFNGNQESLVSNANRGLSTSVTLTLILSLITLLVTYRTMKSAWDQLKERLSVAKNISDKVKDRSDKFIEMSELLSQNSETQTAELTSASSAVAEIQQMTVSSSESAQECFRISKETSEKANLGKTLVTKTKESVEKLESDLKELMNGLGKATSDISEMKALVASISDKTKVINEIVFQTKLLSFNASVEAARAGEHGKGFAVVAEEIARLATMSGESASSINEIITRSEARVGELVSMLEEKMVSSTAQASESIEKTLVQVKESTGLFQTVAGLVNELDRRILSISQAAKEQATGIERIESSVTEINQGNVKVSEDAKSSFESSTRLGDEAKRLLSLMNHLENFLLGVNSKTISVKIDDSSSQEFDEFPQSKAA